MARSWRRVSSLASAALAVALMVGHSRAAAGADFVVRADSVPADTAMRASASDDAPAHAMPGWTAEAYLGGAANFRTTLRIEQPPYSDLRWDAEYDTRAFEMPLYYALRVARWKGDRAWGLDLVHHKLHLRNPPPEVQSFVVSHGYNLLTFGRARRWAGLVLWINAGAVIAHPENTVRGARLSESRGALGLGYYLAGATVGASVAKRFALGPRWLAALEAGFTGSSARVPVEGGHADVPNVALHVRAGLGWGRP